MQRTSRLLRFTPAFAAAGVLYHAAFSESRDQNPVRRMFLTPRQVAANLSMQENASEKEKDRFFIAGLISKMIPEIPKDKAPVQEPEVSSTPAPDMKSNFGLYFDHTLLKPDAVSKDIAALCKEAAEINSFSVCVPSSWVKFAKNTLSSMNSRVKVCSVVGFPHGNAHPQAKALEAWQAVQDGAEEIDMVINIGKLKEGEYEFISQEIGAVQEWIALHLEKKVALKVIIETSYLTTEEKRKVCEICVQRKVDFVKTSTGYSSAGATVEDIQLMSSIVSPHNIQVKASGGIRTRKDAEAMIKAGANRIGASKTVDIVKGTSSSSSSSY